MRLNVAMPLGLALLVSALGCSKKPQPDTAAGEPGKAEPEQPMDLTAKTVEELDKLCEAKNAAACFEAGNRHDQGRSVDQPGMLAALQRWDTACDLKHAQACVVLGDLAAKAAYLTAQERDSNSKSYYETACDLGSSDGCSRLGIHKTGGIAWTVGDDVKAMLELTSVFCSGDPHGSGIGKCEVMATFPRGFGASRSIGVKFSSAAGATLGNDLLFIQPASVGETVQKTIHTYAGTASARIGYW